MANANQQRRQDEGDELPELEIPKISETADGFFTVDGQGDAKYSDEETAKRVAKNIAIAKRAKKAGS